jgi:transposase InsO family protein
VPYCRGGFEHRGRLESRVEALEIFNTDQGSQFTSMDFTGVSLEAEIQISMDGRGRWLDNVFIERLWRSLKHADIYLKHYADGREAKAGISASVDFYNKKRFTGRCKTGRRWRSSMAPPPHWLARAVDMWTTQERCRQPSAGHSIA